MISVRVLIPGLALWKGEQAAAATATAFCRFWQPFAVGGLGEIHFNSQCMYPPAQTQAQVISVSAFAKVPACLTLQMSFFSVPALMSCAAGT